MFDSLKQAGKKVTTKVTNEVSRAWDSMSEGWRELLSRSGNALTHFARGKDEKGDQEIMPDAFPRWSLLAGEVEEMENEIVVRMEIPGIEKENCRITIEDNILHLSGENEAIIPETVRDLKGGLDWDRRHAHMRYHTALHVLSGVIWRNFDAKVTGGQMRSERARMDFSFPGEWTAEVVGEIEHLTNEALAQERSVRVYELPREEALKNPDLIHPGQVLKIPEA